MIKVMIVDDQELIRQSLELMLNNKNNISVIATAENGREAIGLTRSLKPDVILMDIRMPGIDGIECIRIIKENYSEIKIIVLTTFDDDEYVFESLKYGANGFLLKGISLGELVKAIATVHQGGASLEPAIASKVFALFSQMAKSDYSQRIEDSELESLNNNELRIIQLIGQGLSNKEITQRLVFSEGTVRNYISSILRKLDLRDRTQIAIFAIKSGIMLKNFEDKN